MGWEKEKQKNPTGPWGRARGLLVFISFYCCRLLPRGTCCAVRVAGAAKAGQVLPCSQVLKVECLQVTTEFVPALHIRNATQVVVLS